MSFMAGSILVRGERSGGRAAGAPRVPSLDTCSPCSAVSASCLSDLVICPIRRAEDKPKFLMKHLMLIGDLSRLIGDLSRCLAACTRASHMLEAARVSLKAFSSESQTWVKLWGLGDGFVIPPSLTCHLTKVWKCLPRKTAALQVSYLRTKACCKPEPPNLGLHAGDQRAEPSQLPYLLPPG